MATSPHEEVAVPLNLDGAVVGTVSVNEEGQLVAKVTSPGTKSYFTEMLLVNMVSGFSISVDYADEQAPEHIPFPVMGHLRLVKES